MAISDIAERHYLTKVNIDLLSVADGCCLLSGPSAFFASFSRHHYLPFSLSFQSKLHFFLSSLLRASCICIDTVSPLNVLGWVYLRQPIGRGVVKFATVSKWITICSTRFPIFAAKPGRRNSSTAFPPSTSTRWFHLCMCFYFCNRIQ